MRIQALTLLILATLASTATANDEINRLLADLSFGDLVAADQSAAVAEEPKPTQEQVGPFSVNEPAVDTAASGSNATALPAFSELVATGPGLQLPPETPPKAILSRPVPDAAPLVEINLSELNEMMPPKTVSSQPTETKSVGHRRQNSACEPHGYERGIVCMPRVSPNLPTSTFLQYFRGNPCYSNVWDGYRFDCGSHHAHIHGECDCFKRKNSGCEGCDVR